MNCPNCGNKINKNKIHCEFCGSDLNLYRKIWSTSNLYYNRGLTKANIRDLSGAITDLRYSLELNKYNTDARNLLGLIYFEMGETVDALSQWVISKHFKPENNDADRYINAVQSNPTKLDSLNQAIKRYNTALNYAKQGSDDLAIIQLKKVVSLNPHFIRAHHLLALLLIKNNESDRAKRLLIKALKIDVSNTRTLRYLKAIDVPVTVNSDPSAKQAAEPSVTSTIMPLSSYKEDKPNIIAFVNLVIGVVIGIAVTAILVIPSIKKTYQAKENNYYTEYVESLSAQAEKEEAMIALQKDIQKLEEEKKELQEQLDSFVLPEDNSDFYEALLRLSQDYMDELSKSAKDRDLVAIADRLTDNIFNTLDLEMDEREEDANLINRLKAETYPAATKFYYDKGHDLYSDAKYEEALIELDRALTFDPENVDALYFKARAYHRLKDYENASVYYNIVIEDYPDSRRANSSKEYLNKIQ